MMMMISFTLTPRERYAGSTTIYISMHADAVSHFLSEFDYVQSVCVCVISFTLTPRRSDMQYTTTIYPSMYT
jgi:hypothetical protein